MLRADLEERSFGSAYDPLLNGVAHGLARLFPPVEAVRPDGARSEGGRTPQSPAVPASGSPRRD